jgi:hypothetical protein
MPEVAPVIKTKVVSSDMDGIVLRNLRVVVCSIVDLRRQGRAYKVSVYEE